MSTGQLTNNGITIQVSDTSATGHQGGDSLQLVPSLPAPSTPGLALVPALAHGGRTCTALFGAAPCGAPTEEGEGNPDGYCTRHLDLMAGDQEDGESDQQYARRRRHLCPHPTGPGMPGVGWCPEPSHPESEDGFCLIHEPTYNPETPDYDAETAHRLLDETVPCLQCRGGQSCPMCGGTGRITLRRANWHRGDDTDPRNGVTETSNQEASDDAKSTNGAVQVIEGVVIGHARCSYKEGCTEPSKRVIDPYQREIYGETVEIDICETHFRELRDDI